VLSLDEIDSLLLELSVPLVEDGFLSLLGGKSPLGISFLSERASVGELSAKSAQAQAPISINAVSIRQIIFLNIDFLKNRR
jgi:hypothetical protein